MRTILPLSLLAALSLGLLVIWSAGLDQELSDVAAAPDRRANAAGTTPDAAERLGSGPPQQSGSTVRKTPQAGPGDPIAAALPEADARAPVRIDLTTQIGQLRRQARNWTAARYLDLAASGEPISAELAFELYAFLDSCRGRPRTAAELEATMGRYAAQHGDKAQPVELEHLDAAMNALEKDFLRCGGLDVDLTAAAYQTLEMSADAGFMPAIVEYLSNGAGLLLSEEGWLFAHPEYAARYRLRAADYAARALANADPEAILAYGRFLYAGTVKPPDRTRGYAYVWTAAQLDHRARGFADGLLASMRREMNRDEVEAAETLGATLCERYCEPPPGR